MINGQIPEGLTFDDVLLLPGKSSVLPLEADTRTCFTRNLALNIPLASAAMDTVTESRLAIAIARQGGIGIVHKNMPIDRQAEEVDRVKRSESGMIVDPVTISPDQPIAAALERAAFQRVVLPMPASPSRRSARGRSSPNARKAAIAACSRSRPISSGRTASTDQRYGRQPAKTSETRSPRSHQQMLRLEVVLRCIDP